MDFIFNVRNQGLRIKADLNLIIHSLYYIFGEGMFEIQINVWCL